MTVESNTYKENILTTSGNKSTDLTEMSVYLGDTFVGLVDIPLLVKQRDETYHAAKDNYSDDVDCLLSFIDAIIDSSGYTRS